MNIYEYQAKALLEKYGLPVPKGKVIAQSAEAANIAKEIGPGPWAVKAQILSGGRAKAGGIKIAQTLEEVEQYTQEILNSPLKTYQSANLAKKVRKVLIEEGCNIDQEFYLALTVDRLAAKVVLISSSQGGVEIEETAKENPAVIFKEYIDPGQGLAVYQARNISFKLGITDKDLPRPSLDKKISLKEGRGLLSAVVKFMLNFYRLFVESDCLLAEINPLAITKEKEIVALDAKLQFDESALSRQPEIAQLRDLEEELPQETAARKHNLSYIGLAGNIGCMVNGAGLAMATMDTIKAFGGEPANFLDVGGGASWEMVAEAFKILASDEKVKAILVNIFGGILKCDLLAQGIVAACQKVKLKVPLIVRLEGTNVEKGREILKNSGLNIISESTMKEAAQRAVELAKCTDDH